MALVRKSITVTDRQEQWIRAQVASGGYGNDHAGIGTSWRRAS